MWSFFKKIKEWRIEKEKNRVYKKAIGLIVKKIREDSKKTPQEFAKDIGIEYKKLCDIEFGASLPDSKTIENIKLKYGVGVETVFRSERMKVFELFTFTSMVKMLPTAQDQVNKGFRIGMKPHIEKVKEMLSFLQDINKYCTRKVDVYKDRDIKTIVTLLSARIIILSNAVVGLIEREESTGSATLLRIIYEANDLLRYFWWGTQDKDMGCKKDIARWWRGKVIPNEKVRKYMVSKKGFPEVILKRLYKTHSQITHNTYPAILESYKRLSFYGPFIKAEKDFGFDYRNPTNLRDLATVLGAFESLFESIMTTHLEILPQAFPDIITEEDLAKLVEYNNYYREKHKTGESLPPPF